MSSCLLPMPDSAFASMTQKVILYRPVDINPVRENFSRSHVSYTVQAPGDTFVPTRIRHLTHLPIHRNCAMPAWALWQTLFISLDSPAWSYSRRDLRNGSCQPAACLPEKVSQLTAICQVLMCPGAGYKVVPLQDASRRPGLAGYHQQPGDPHSPLAPPFI